MPRSTDPPLGSSLPEDTHAAGAGKRCPDAINRARQPSALRTPSFTHLPSVLPDSSPPRPRNKELPVLFANPARAVVGKQHLLSQPPAQTRAWRRDKLAVRTSLPLHAGWGNRCDFKWQHHGPDPQPLDSELLGRETTTCSSARITGITCRDLRGVVVSYSWERSCSHGYTRCLRQETKGDHASGKLPSAAAMLHARGGKMVALWRNLSLLFRASLGIILLNIQWG